ncbi:MAG TPA: sigma-70 family RNA polymerase sigma factor, partial [Armatimonadota bacterium]
MARVLDGRMPRGGVLQDEVDEDRREAREALVRANTPLVKSIAAKYTSSGEPFEDLVQEGYLGLLSAIDLFEPSQGIQFSTYAYYLISGQIRHYLRDRGALIRQPAWIQELRSKVDRTTATLTEKLGRDPSVREVAAETGLSEEKVREVQATGRMTRVLRLQSSESDEDGGSVDPERVMVDPSQTELSVEQRMVLGEALAKLKDVEQRVVEAFFFQGFTQAEIARKLRVSHNYVSRVLRNSTRRLQSLLDEGVLGGGTPEGISVLLHGTPARSHSSGGVLDKHTGLYNSEHILQRLGEELLRAQRYGHALAVMALVIRTAEGELLRDATLLKEAGTLVRTCFRRIDVVGRGGESCFLVLMPHTGSAASVAGERFQSQVASHPVLGAKGVTSHYGVCVYPEDSNTADGL